MTKREELKAKYRAKIAELDAFVKEMNSKTNWTEEERKEYMKAVRLTNKYLKAIGADESEMYDV